MAFSLPLSPPADSIISVSVLNQTARQLLETGLPAVWISGEISNLTLAASGHAYFSLKDTNAQVRCVMFRQKLALLPFRLSEGMQVELKGLVTLYEARGDFQINVDRLRSAGLGRLYEAFEKLKAKLQAEGLFDSQDKRALPSHPRAIGIVTSLAAAALRDVLSTLKRRMPSLPIIIYPSPVQGEGAAAQLVQAVNQAALRQEVDVLIICRGGGSIEDLWSFNDEQLARAIAACPIPTVSGVGHETDFTICDFVADHRAPTPTAAAELVSPSQEQLQRRLDSLQLSLQQSFARLLANQMQKLDFMARRLIHPGEKLQQQHTHLQAQQQRLQRSWQALLSQRHWALRLTVKQLQQAAPKLRDAQQQLSQQQQRLQTAQQQYLSQHQQHLAKLAATLGALSPQAVLERGYAIVQKQNGIAVKASSELAQHERVRLQLASGSTEAIIEHEYTQQPSLPF